MQQGTDEGSSHQQHDELGIKDQPAMDLAFCKVQITFSALEFHHPASIHPHQGMPMPCCYCHTSGEF